MRLTVVTLLLTACAAVPVAGQQSLDWNPAGLQLSRSELQSMLSRYEEVAQSSAYSGSLRDQAKDEAALIKDRLENGDFHVGDQIDLSVEGETALTTTFTIVGDTELDLPGIGRIPMKGVLRSELEDHLTKELSRYIRDPVVRAHALLRLEVRGAVGRPGFYVFPSTTLLTDVLMQSGGPTQTADMDKIKIERGDEVIWSGHPVQTAIREGRTLDQLSIQAGDEIEVGQTKSHSINVLSALRFVAIGIPALIFAARRIFP